jgi:3-oxoacyl-[acyl-carrier protein] reductase
MSNNNGNRLAIVTGAAGGIGYGIAQELGRSGYEVAMVDVQKELLDAAVGTLRKEGIRASGIAVDLASEEDLARIPALLQQGFERTAVLVNNAGISPKHAGKKLGTVDIPLQEWERVLKINITAPFRLCQLVLPVMMRNGWGRIINISSKGARTPGGVAGIHYVTSKAGMLGFTRSLARDYAKYGITANAIAPGRIESPMTGGSAGEVQARMLESIPVGRIGQPREVGALAAFLASDEAGFITGATIDINGGAVMM